MGHFCTRGSSGNGRCTGIAEEVQHTQRGFAGADLASHPIPMSSLFGEDADMSGRSELQLEFEVLVFNRPGFIHRVKDIPFAAIFLLFLDKSRIGFFPFSGR